MYDEWNAYRRVMATAQTQQVKKLSIMLCAASRRLRGSMKRIDKAARSGARKGPLLGPAESGL